MNKRIIFNRFTILLAMAAAGSAAISCRKDNTEQIIPEQDGSSIELRINAQTGTKAEVDYTGKEWKMDKVDLFFYASGASETDRPVLVWHGGPEVEAKHGGTISVKIPTERVDEVFGTENKCKVYAAINVNVSDDVKEKFETTDYTKAPTIAELREIKASAASFATQKELKNLVMFTNEDVRNDATHTDPNIVNYNPDTRKATGKIYVKNLTSKIDLYVNFSTGVQGKDPTDDGGEMLTWNVYDPMNTAEVYLINGVRAVRLGGWNGGEFLIPEDYFDLRKTDDQTINPQDLSRGLAQVADTDENSGDYTYVTDVALYTCPNEWTSTVLETHRTSLILKVNWLPENGNTETDLRETYYTVPLNFKSSADADKFSLESNKYYRVKININTLGGMYFGEPLELEDCSWEVLDWGSTELESDIREIRWLGVSHTQKDLFDGEIYNAIMYNTKSVTIPYNTTHKIKVENVSVKYWNFTTSDYDPELVSVLYYRELDSRGRTKWYGGKDFGFDTNIYILDQDGLNKYISKGLDPQGIYVDQIAQTVTFYHSLSTLMGNGAEGIYEPKGIKTYSPFYIQFDIVHVDDPNYTKTIKIKQYPAIYITAEKTDENVGFLTSNGGLGTQGRGGIYVNGGAKADFRGWNAAIDNASRDCNVSQLGGVGGRGNADNPYMYSLHITQLEEDDFPTSWNNTEGALTIYGQGEVPVKFHVGDPRAKYVNNNLGSGSNEDLKDEADNFTQWTSAGNRGNNDNYREAPADRNSFGAQRLYTVYNSDGTKSSTLRYYYPTRESQMDEDKWMIAPVIRLSSGYAVERNGGNNLSRERARQRCASFQEQGYPAGRWRVPTVGELYFYKMLYNKGVLPDIFASDRSMWTAQGVLKTDINNSDIRFYSPGDVDPKRVRCVYDDWYWVKEDNVTPDNNQNNIDKIEMISGYSKRNDVREMFVWGDKPKNNPQEQPQD